MITASVVKTVKIRPWVAKPKRTRPSAHVTGNSHKWVAIDWVTTRSTRYTTINYIDTLGVSSFYI